MASTQREIRTPRLLLRPITDDDVHDIFTINANPEVMKYISRPPATDIEETRAWLADHRAGPSTFQCAAQLLHPEADGAASEPRRVIGILGSPTFPNIGYLFHPDYQGKGYATEALRAFVPAMFGHMPRAGSAGARGYDYVQAFADTENVRSRAVLERCGFAFCGVVPGEFSSPLLGLRDSACYRLARSGEPLDQMQLQMS
ncbi:hypothetical protein LTR50_007058 [Elasticomyces elasticus]|nr:hypothetical protein LTR50_007058 [Elasticomyces elasticus]